MHSILRIIQYLFKKSHAGIIEKTFNSFFSNGVSFPRFVALSFGITEIPNFNPNPKTIFHKNINNNSAYKYLLKNNEEIAKVSPNFNSEDDQICLLSLILTKQCFKMNVESILNQCNEIIQPLNIVYKSKNDLLTLNCLSSLLYVLTNEKNENYIDQNINYDQIQMIFEEEDVPLIIDKSYSQSENQYLFLIQIQIIFDIFSNKIKRIEANSNSKGKEAEKNKQTKSVENGDKILQNELNEETKSVENGDKILQIQSTLNDISEAQESSKEILDILDDLNDLDDQNDDENKNDLDNLDDLDNQNDNDKIDGKKYSNNKKDDDDMDFEYNFLKNQILLKAINEVGRNANLKFNNFDEAVKKDNLPKFLHHLLKNDENSQKELYQIIQSNKKYNEKLDSVLEFLRSKDLRFKLLLLDFEHSHLIEASSIILYEKIMECFFLKTTKEKITNRFATILQMYEDLEVFYLYSNMYNYFQLIFFIKEGAIKDADDDDLYSYDSISDFSKKYKDVPIIISDEFMKEFGYWDTIPIGLYCQIQLIFDYFDRNSKYHVLEYFWIANKMFATIKIPDYKNLANSIEAKNISSIQQIRRNMLYSKEKEENQQTTSKIQKTKAEIPQEPKKFKDRFLESNDIIQTQKSKNDEDIMKDSYSFWNPPDNDHIFNDGVLYNVSKEKMGNLSDFWMEWANDFKKITKKRKLSNVITKMPSFDALKRKDVKSHLYKIFIYDEESKNWNFDSNALDQLKINNGIDPSKIKTPFFIFFNSYEKDSIEVCSKLTNYELPDLDENDQIFVYGLCDRKLSLLSYNIDMSPQKASVMPIFLLLHVPKSKQKIQNIGQIVFQIYTYLISIECIVIFILNMNKINQLDFQNEINYINCTFSPVTNFSFSSSSSDNIEIDEYSDDGDNEEVDDKKLNNVVIDQKEELLQNFSEELSFQKPKYIILFNEETYQFDQNIFNKYERILTNEYEINSLCSFINIKDSTTYEPFLNSLNKFALCDCKHYNLSNFESYSKYLPLFEMSSTYIKLNNIDDDDNLDELREKIKERFEMIKKQYPEESSQFSIISKLKKEINTTFPLLDNQYSDNINHILSDLKMEITGQNKSRIKKELQISSYDKLVYLSKIVKSEPFWSKEQINSIQNAHVKFLKDEYFSIIHELFPPNLLLIIYNDNQNVLNEQISNDIKSIILMFEDYSKKLEKKKPIERKVQKGTNYTIRERENEREVKVKVEAGNLEDYIKQDF